MHSQNKSGDKDLVGTSSTEGKLQSGLYGVIYVAKDGAHYEADTVRVRGGMIQVKCKDHQNSSFWCELGVDEHIICTVPADDSREVLHSKGRSYSVNSGKAAYSLRMSNGTSFDIQRVGRNGKRLVLVISDDGQPVYHVLSKGDTINVLSAESEVASDEQDKLPDSEIESEEVTSTPTTSLAASFAKARHVSLGDSIRAELYARLSATQSQAPAKSAISDAVANHFHQTSSKARIVPPSEKMSIVRQIILTIVLLLPVAMCGYIVYDAYATYVGFPVQSQELVAQTDPLILESSVGEDMLNFSKADYEIRVVDARVSGTDVAQP